MRLFFCLLPFKNTKDYDFLCSVTKYNDHGTHSHVLKWFPASVLCDGKKNCDDGSDETGCGFKGIRNNN